MQSRPSVRHRSARLRAWPSQSMRLSYTSSSSTVFLARLFLQEDDDIKVPACGHAFHKDCLRRWLQKGCLFICPTRTPGLLIVLLSCSIILLLPFSLRPSSSMFASVISQPPSSAERSARSPPHELSTVSYAVVEVGFLLSALSTFRASLTGAGSGDIQLWPSSE